MKVERPKQIFFHASRGGAGTIFASLLGEVTIFDSIMRQLGLG